VTAAKLREAIDEVSAIDHHAHLLAAPGTPSELAAAFSESRHTEQAAQMRHHPAYERALRELGRLLDVAPSEDAIAAARLHIGPDEYTRRLIRACGFEAMLIDDGYTFDGVLTLEQHADLVSCALHRVARIEAIAETAAIGWPPFADVRTDLRQAVDDALAHGAVALKTIAAYRCGLGLAELDEAAAGTAYDRWRRTASPRLTDAHLIAFFLDSALDVARARGAPVPLQVHTGLGDADLEFTQARPALLQPAIERRWADVPIVLLHTYPWVREAGWLAHVYPNVYMDLSLALSFATHRGPELVLEALDLAPATKLLFATDASRTPEPFVLGTRWWRDALTRALGRLVDDDVIDAAVALRWAERVLAENARQLYRLPIGAP
jgi:predicted TIM-barrel fold metal-dependent hydrolase